VRGPDPAASATQLDAVLAQPGIGAVQVPCRAQVVVQTGRDDVRAAAVRRMLPGAVLVVDLFMSSSSLSR
jgi:hypothetical protein